MSGIAIQEDRLLTLVQKEGQQFVIALEARTGKPLWQTAIASEYRNAMGDGPRATPAIAGNQVFAFTGEGVLAALDMKTGAIKWSHNVVEQLGGTPAEYGTACSPLVVDKQVIVTAGAPRGAVAAYDLQSGELAWTAERDLAGYSSPALLEVGGRSQIVAFTGSAAIGLAPGTGKLLWRHPFKTNFDCNIATPLAWQGKVFISSGENHGSALLALKPVSAGYEVEEVWTSFGPKSVLRNEWQTSMLVDGYLYGMDNVGGAGPITHLTCVNIATGERVWQKLRFGKGNLIYADGKLLIATMNGELVLVRATPKAFEELARAKVLEPTRQAPALAQGLLYLRDHQEIVCLDMRKR